MAKLIDGRESGFKNNPDYKILFEPSPRRVRVTFNGATIADSTKPICCSRRGICRSITSRGPMCAWSSDPDRAPDLLPVQRKGVILDDPG